MNLLKLILFLLLPFFSIYLKAAERVTLQLDWLHQFQFAGYYMAKEKGFYKENNLDVTIKEFTFKTNLVNNVLNLKSEYAIGKSSLILDKLEGKNIVLLSAIYQNSPMVLISLKKSNINKVKDLKGKKVMLTTDARSSACINSMIISQGLKLKDINFQDHSFQLEDLINGTTDAIGSYLSNEPYQLDKKGIAYTIHNPNDYGFDFYGGILFTSQKELKNNPSRVKKFHEASLKGWAYAFENIEETANLIFNKYNTQNKTLDSLIYEGKVLKKLSGFDKGLLGKIDLEKVEEIKRLYLLLYLSNNNLKKAIDNLIYDPSSINLSPKEKEYLKNNKITLFSNSNLPPFTLKNKNKNLIGIEIEYWNLINKKLNNTNKTVIEFNNNKEAIKNIIENRNIVKYSFSKHDDNELLAKTATIYHIPIGLVTLNNKPFISDMSYLENKRVAIPKYSSLYELFKSKYPNIELVPTSNLAEGLDLLSKNKVFGVIEKLPSLSYIVSKESSKNIKISGIFKEEYNLKLVVNKENDILLNILNKAISSITQKEINSINSKYYSVIYQTATDYSWIYKIVIPLVIILFIITFSNRKLSNEIKKRKAIEEELNEAANIDSLTNCYNRRKIDSILNKELNRVKRYKRALTIIFFDVDNFKEINDTLGHNIGDEVLIKISSITKSNIRSTDFFGRWGGEEFIIILPETTKEQATNVAHLLKEKISNNDFSIERKITCSFGISQYEETDSADTLLTRADNAMYFVKRNGKNSVKVV